MAWEVDLLTIPMISSGNNSGNQFKLVTPGSAANSITLATASTVDVLGVLQNTPTTGGGDAASVMVQGVSKVYKTSTAAAITYGDLLVSTTSGGVKTGGAAEEDYYIGTALETMAAGTTGILTMLITHNGRGSSGA